MSAPGLPRLLQIADSSFPVGGYAYSHGLEWLVHEGLVRSPDDLAEVLATFIPRVAGGQWFPAAVGAFRARSLAAVARIDGRLDASIAAESEREAGRAMGSRLLHVAAKAWGDVGLGRYKDAVEGGEAAGQFAVAFALAARASGVEEQDMCHALGFSMVSSLTQAAIRLGAIGAEAAAALIEGARPLLEAAVIRQATTPRPQIGAFAPSLELAAMLQPTLRFRMFAS